MKKKYLFASVLILIGACTAIGYYKHEYKKHIILFDDAAEAIGGDDDIEARTNWELARLADPATGKIPDHIRQLELAYAAGLPKLEFTSFAGARSASSISIDRRGPWNVGGRTRALAIDITNENIVFAGSASGGLWRSTDGGVTWSRISRLTDNESITSITQDKRSGHTNTWYYSTGEPYIGYGGTFGLGNGIYKSTDGGLTWNFLPATSSNSPQSFDNVWDLTYKVICDQSDTVNDVVYAACFGSIFKSTNGGATWASVRGSVSGNNFAFFTDVDVTTTGVVYGTLTSESNLYKGIWRKSASTTWTNITPLVWTDSTFNRVVIGINPSNENEVYFLGETPNIGKATTNYKGDVEWNSLWKYTYISGNGTGAGGLWTDLSPNIPFDSSQLGNFNSQGGYDLIVKVHPDSSNIVFIGGTNLFRSTDGFTTTNNTTTIGGYAPGSTIPFYSVYPNHHPDQHNLTFLPSNHDIMFSSCDGGVNKTLNNRASTIVWNSLNEGYVTTQFYSVAMDHGSTPNNILIGGLQDNGCWFTNNTNYTTPWSMIGNSDGAFTAIDNGHANYYVSRQEGRMAKATVDVNGNVTAYRRIDPLGGSNYLFVNPFILDPNNNNIMYVASGNRVWRNDSLTSIPLNGQWDSISMGWFQMPDTVPYAGNVVTALAASKTPANRLYIGTNKKIIYRVDNANTSTPVTTDISDTMFDSGGYINCIAVDPNNADHIVVVLSNYKIYSLFYSSDGGVNWTKVAGNLEENSNTTGLGNGPSVLWASIIPVSTGTVYLAGTSVGLFGTNTLNGTSTVWTQLAPNEIGNMIVNMMDYRTSDGLVAIATYGAGIFSTTITDSIPTNLAEVNPLSFNISTYPNPSSEKVTIQFYSTERQNISLNVYDANGNLVESIINEEMKQGHQEYILERKNRAAGIYFIQLKASGKSYTKKIVFV